MASETLVHYQLEVDKGELTTVAHIWSWYFEYYPFIKATRRRVNRRVIAQNVSFTNVFISITVHLPLPISSSQRAKCLSYAGSKLIWSVEMTLFPTMLPASLTLWKVTGQLIKFNLNINKNNLTGNHPVTIGNSRWQIILHFCSTLLGNKFYYWTRIDWQRLFTVYSMLKKISYQIEENSSTLWDLLKGR